MGSIITLIGLASLRILNPYIWIFLIYIGVMQSIYSNWKQGRLRSVRWIASIWVLFAVTLLAMKFEIGCDANALLGCIEYGFLLLSLAAAGCISQIFSAWTESLSKKWAIMGLVIILILVLFIAVPDDGLVSEHILYS